MESATKPIILPHCHLYARFFPDDFKGKIVHITRDQRQGLQCRLSTKDLSCDKLGVDPLVEILVKEQ